MDKAKIADHGGLWAIVTGVAVFAIFAALSVGHVVPQIGHAILVPFDRMLVQQGLHVIVINTTSKERGAGSATSTPAPIPPVEVAPQNLAQTPSSPDLFVKITVAGSDIVQFDIVNRGGTKVPSGWVFIAGLPSGEHYTSPLQPALQPGQGFSYTLEIDNQATVRYAQYQPPPCNVIPATQIYYGTPYPFQQSDTCTSRIQNAGAVVPPAHSVTVPVHGTFSIVVDPYGQTSDSNRINNRVAVWI